MITVVLAVTLHLRTHDCAGRLWPMGGKPDSKADMVGFVVARHCIALSCALRPARHGWGYSKLGLLLVFKKEASNGKDRLQN
ncbi:hypothetical protein ACP4OV_028203 [Aristida adscensionis]